MTVQKSLATEYVSTCEVVPSVLITFLQPFPATPLFSHSLRW